MNFDLSGFVMEWASPLSWTLIICWILIVIRSRTPRLLVILFFSAVWGLYCISEELEHGPSAQVSINETFEQLKELNVYEINFPEENLNEAQLQALVNASNNNYVVHGMQIEINGKIRNLVMLGEVHYKSSKEEIQAGKQVVAAFNHIAVEGCPAESNFLSRTYSWISLFYDAPLMVIAKILPFMDYTTIEHALDKSQYVVDGEIISSNNPFTVTNLREHGSHYFKDSNLLIQLESGDLSSFDQDYLHLPYAYKSVILDKRNLRMAANIDRYFEVFPEKDNLLIIVGMLHVPGIRDLYLMRTASNLVERSE